MKSYKVKKFEIVEVMSSKMKTLLLYQFLNKF